MSSLTLLRDFIKLRYFIKKRDIKSIKLLLTDLSEQVLLLSTNTNPISSPPSPQNHSLNNLFKTTSNSNTNTQTNSNTNTNTSLTKSGRIIASPNEKSNRINGKSSITIDNTQKKRFSTKIKKYSGSDKSIEYLSLKVLQNELMIAKTMTRVIEIQNNYLVDLNEAVNNKDIININQLLLKANKLELNSHVTVLNAKNQLISLHEKKRILLLMIHFLQNETDEKLYDLNSLSEIIESTGLVGPESKMFSKSIAEKSSNNNANNLEDNNANKQENIKQILKKAKELEIDEDFISKVSTNRPNASISLYLSAFSTVADCSFVSN